MGVVRHRIPFLAIVGLTVAVLAVIAALFLAREQSRSGEWAAHSLRVEVQLTELTDHVRAIESDHRGYVLTRDPRMKAQLVQLTSELRPAVDRLQQEIRDNPTQLANIGPLRKTLNAKVAFAMRGVA